MCCEACVKWVRCEACAVVRSVGGGGGGRCVKWVRCEV